MTSEIRVTVVATGLGRQPVARNMVAPGRDMGHGGRDVGHGGRDIGHGGRDAGQVGRESPQMRMVHKRVALTPTPDYRILDRPAYERQRAVGDGLRAEPASSEELLDIPAFLRRQAD
jgi:hypothetical protein